METESRQGSHGLFFAFSFMVLVLLGTVVTYFVFLPGTAPKQITLAVFPFAGDEIPRELTHGLAFDLRNSLANSRDVMVVDFPGTVEAVEEANALQDPRQALGVTHFVDGSIQFDEGQQFSLVELRVINVSQSAWKEVYVETIGVANEEWAQFHAKATVYVREALYDLNTMRTPSISSSPVEYSAHLNNLVAVLDEHHPEDSIGIVDESNLALDRAVQLIEFQRLNANTHYVHRWLDLFDGTEAPGFRTYNLLKDLDATNEASEFVLALEKTVSDYPNSSSVVTLAELYQYFGWLDAAEFLWIRWSQMRPRAVGPAVALANLNHIRGNTQGSAEALAIGVQRSGESQEAIEWQRHYDQLSMQTGTKSDTENPSDKLDCAQRFVVALAQKDQEVALSAHQCSEHAFLNPPIFWRSDDPRWTSWLDYIELPRVVSTDLAPRTAESVKLLLAPRRIGE